MKYILASLVIVFFGLFGLLNPVKTIVLNIISPVQFGLAKTANSTKSLFSFFTNSNQVRRENLELLNRVQSLEDQIAKLKFAKDENLLLRSQLELKDVFVETPQLLLADVMINSDNISDDSLFINLGSRDGLREGDMAVVGRNLVGTVKNVEYSRSTVQLITSPLQPVTVYDLDSVSHPQGLAKGKHGTYLSLERILVTEQISEGDTIVTSGKDGVFEPNFVVGTITKVIEDPSQPLKSAEVKTSLDFSRISKVFIIKSID